MSDEPVVEPLDFGELAKMASRFPRFEESEMLPVPGPLRFEPEEAE